MAANVWCHRKWLKRTAALVATSLLGIIAADFAEGAEPIDFQMEQTWKVSASANGYTRKKEVKATFDIRAEQVSQDPIQLKLTFTRVKVDVDVPAQKREARFDSQTYQPSDEFTAYELGRSAALLDRTLEWHFGPRGESRELKGAVDLLTGLDTFYDQHLKGSEADQLTREAEREQLGADMLAERWREAFVPQLSDTLIEAGHSEEERTVHVLACLPSESWLRSAEIPLRQKTTLTRQGSGGGSLKREWSLKSDSTRREKTKLGPSPWSYEPTSANGAATIEYRSDGLVDRMESQIKVVFFSYLTLDQRDIALDMTVEHLVSVHRTKP